MNRLGDVGGQDPPSEALDGEEGEDGWEEAVVDGEGVDDAEDRSFLGEGGCRSYRIFCAALIHS